MPYLFGVDTAFSNTLTASRVQQLDFAIPRIGTLGYGGVGTSSYLNKSLSVDSAFSTNIANLHNASKYAGCYFFSYAWNTTSAIYEANKVCDWLDANNVSLELPVFFDWEYDSDNRTTAAGVPVSNATLQALTVAFMARVSARGRTSGWYSNMDYVNNKYGSAWTTARMAENYYFWVASWSGASNPPRSCDIWQYAGDVNWQGIDADLNYIIDTRCINGQPPTPGQLPTWLLTILATRRKPPTHTIYR